MKTGGFQFQISDESFLPKVACDPRKKDCGPLALSFIGLNSNTVTNLQSTGKGMHLNNIENIFIKSGMGPENGEIYWNCICCPDGNYSKGDEELTPREITERLIDIMDTLDNNYGKMVAGIRRGTSGHYFIIAKIKNQKYIIDTQRQVVVKEQDMLEYITRQRFHCADILTIKTADGRDWFHNLTPTMSRTPTVWPTTGVWPPPQPSVSTVWPTSGVTWGAGKSRKYKSIRKKKKMYGGKKYRSKRKRFIKKRTKRNN